MFDNIWNNICKQYTYSFFLSFELNLKAQEQRVGGPLQLGKLLDLTVHRAKEEYAKRIRRIEEILRSGNLFVSRSGE